MPPVLSLHCIWRKRAMRRRPVMFAQGSKRGCHSYLYRGQSYTGSLAPYEWCVFTVRTANTLFTFILLFFFFFLAIAKFQETGFLCQLPWWLVSIVGKGVAQGRVHFWVPHYCSGAILCIIILKGSYVKREQVEVKKWTEIFKWWEQTSRRFPLQAY